MDSKIITSDNYLPEVKIDPPSIHETSVAFNFQDPQFDPIVFAHTLAKTMLKSNAIGLAASQIGVNVRALAMKATPIIVMYNPRIVNQSEEEVVLEEGCVSFPGLYTKVKRPRRVKVRYTEPNGNTVTKQFEDLSARIFLHEYDHLNGITMIDRTPKIKRESLEVKIKQLKRKSKTNTLQ